MNPRQIGKSTLASKMFLVSLREINCVICYDTFRLDEPTRGGVHYRLCSKCSDKLYDDIHKGSRGMFEQVNRNIKLVDKLNTI